MNTEKGYFHTFYQRKNVIQETLFNFALSLSSYPRLILEVFIRRNMGERYFSFSSAIIIFIVLASAPLIRKPGMWLYSAYGNYQEPGIFSKIIQHPIWYLFLAAFLYQSIQRRREIKRLPSAIRFKRFSVDHGQLLSMFENLTINGKFVTRQTIETMVEPAVVLGIGLVLMLLGQGVGTLLIVCSVIYSLSHAAQHNQGYDYILNVNDERICNEQIVKAFEDERESTDTLGVRFYGPRPADPEARRKVADMLRAKEEVVVAM